MDSIVFICKILKFLAKCTGASPILHYAIPHPLLSQQIRGRRVWHNAKLDWPLWRHVASVAVQAVLPNLDGNSEERSLSSHLIKTRS